MISKLQIENFKAFKELDLRFAPLTVLTGLNSSGKSTVIQALLLAQVASGLSRTVPLNGPFGLNLGEASAVLHSESTQASVRIALHGPSGIEEVRLDIPIDRSTFLVKKGRRARRPRIRDAQIDAYLSAERLGPRELSEIAPSDEPQDLVGERGQFAAYALVRSERMKISERLLHPRTGGENLPITMLDQVEAWLSSIIRPIQLTATWLPDVGAAALRFRDPSLFSEWTRPANVGFGFSYVLPILVAGLVARPSSILIVENPEAHLHPAGQSAIGEFLVRVAAAGVQTVVETHSDHVLNGIRLAIGAAQLLHESDATIHFFRKGRDSTEVNVQPSGSLTAWPQGFFDQSELDLYALAQIQPKR